MPAPFRRRLLLPNLRPLIAAARPSPTGLANALTPRLRSVRHAGLAYGAGRRHRLDLYLPVRRAATTPLLVFLYGGGWQMGERGDYAFLARVLAARGIAVAVPDYRLWPDSGWPDFTQDAADAVAWLRGEAGQAAGAPGGPLFLMGHSAGGFIAAALALDPGWLGATALPGGRAAIAACITLAAPFEWIPREEPLAAIFAQARDGAIRAAPEKAEGLLAAPPMLLMHGAADNVVSPLQSAHMVARLRRAGRDARLRIYPGVGHIAILAAMAAPVRALGLARAPVLRDVLEFLGRPAATDRPGAAAA